MTLLLSDFCCRKPEISVLIWSKCSSILESVETGVDVSIGGLLFSLRTLVSRCSLSVVDPRDSSCLLVLRLASNPERLLAPIAFDVGLKETHLLVDPGMSLGHLPWGLTRLLLRELAIMSSLGLKSPSHIKGLELQFCRDFCDTGL